MKLRVNSLTASLALATFAMAAPAAAEPFSLNILHINDHHSHLEADTGVDLHLGGEKTRVVMGGFPAVVSKFGELAPQKENLLKLHAGDAITGDLYYTLFDGKADAEMMNQICFDAFALGNHEFDAGDAGLKRFLEYLSSPLCQTDVLAANVVPEVGVSPLAPKTQWDYFQPYTIKSFAGDNQVGIIGLDIANKTKNSSSPDETTLFLDETETAQRYIDELKAKGIEKIVLLTHYQYDNDLELASKLTGVDVIIGGDSHTLLGDFDAVGLNSAGAYPTMVSNADGEPVCVAHAWQYSAVVGELDVTFDGDKVANCAGTPHLLLGDSFKRKNSEGKRVELTGADRDAVLTQVAATANLSLVEPDTQSAQLLAGYRHQVEEMSSQVVGQVSENLCMERIPGQGRSKLCDVSATAVHGSDISTLVAQAFLEQAVRGQVAIQNGGGVRTDVAAGAFTIGHAYRLLPFANTLAYLEMNGKEIKQVLEEALDYALDDDGSTGAYPYAAGLRFDVNKDQPFGQRISQLQVRPKGESNWRTLRDDEMLTVVTNNYIAAGRDGYRTFGEVSKRPGHFEDSYLDYAQSFVDYVKRRGTIGKLELADYSTQAFR